MRVDLHLHGRYSIATSKSLSLEEITLWAHRKGIHVAGTGDIVHPAWLEEAERVLKINENGLYDLIDPTVLGRYSGQACRFMLTTELSTIYSDGGRVRKVHHLVIVPNLTAARLLSENLSRVGNVCSDGRPILGITSRDLLEIVLESDDNAFLIPAHIWTPWFSVLGSKSGYNSIEECYKDLSHHIFAIETGLSSDPAMNWRVAGLDKFAIVSNSDAHSARKLGREATILDCDLSFSSIRAALGDVSGTSLTGTIEFFPEEGKYHLDGHRKCGMRMEPEDTVRHDGLCPVCGKPLTVGVLHRVRELADRPQGFRPDSRPPFFRLLPLDEVLSQVLGRGVNTHTVRESYFHLIDLLGSEIDILLDTPVTDIEIAGGDRLAEGIARLREGNVLAQGGFDGEYGTISIFAERGGSLVSDKPAAVLERASESVKPVSSEPADYRERIRVVETMDRCIVVTAGPGSGKTHLLTKRIANLSERCGKSGVRSGKHLGITFTRAAARSLRKRAMAMEPDNPFLWAGTLHQLCYDIIRTSDFDGLVCEDIQLARLLSWFLRKRRIQISLRQSLGLIRSIARKRIPSNSLAAAIPVSYERLVTLYDEAKREAHVYDYEDLLSGAIRILKTGCPFEVEHLFIDEFQDLDEDQYQLIILIASNVRTMLAIGDPHQSIYGFRGANPSFFLGLDTEFKNVTKIRLQTSFRCGQNILNCASAVIGSDHRMVAHDMRRGRVDLIRVSTPRAEARMIAGKIRDMIGGSAMIISDRGQSMEDLTDLSDIAVLVRTSRQIPVIASAFDEMGIPYRASTSLPLLAIRRFEKIAAWLRLSRNFDSIPDRLTLGDIEGELMNIGGEVGDLLVCMRNMSPLEAILEMQASHLVRGTVTDAEWQDLKRIAQNHDEMIPFLQQISTEDETGIVDPRAAAVRIMTIHASKGLEFGAVFITGFKEGLLPLNNSDLAEEERLCYVALTRAKYYVCLSWDGAEYDISRFGTRLPENCVHRPEFTRQQGVQLELEFGK